MEKDLQEFSDEVYKVLAIMGVSSEEKVELVSYQLKGVLKYGMINRSPKEFMMVLSDGKCSKTHF